MPVDAAERTPKPQVAGSSPAAPANFYIRNGPQRRQAGVLVGFALEAAVSYSWSNAAWGEGFSWAVFAGGGGGWAIGVGIVTAAVIAVRNALRSL